jgi:hypothetical protein
MSEPRRFLEGGGGEIERLVMDAARGEGPSGAARRRVEVALGLGAAGVAAATAATATAKAAPAASVAGGIGGAGTVHTGVAAGLTKWIGVAAVTGLAAAGAAGYLQATPPRAEVRGAERSKPDVSVSESERRVAPAPSRIGVLRAAQIPSATTTGPASPSGAPAAAAPSLPPIASAAPAAHSAPLRPAVRLSDELHSLDAARAALQAGDTALAFALLDKHDRDFSPPALAPEAMALRVEAHARAGDHAGAARLAARFLALYGDRPEAQRVRSLLAAETREGSGSDTAQKP